jgi:hypothetical protein
LLQQTLGINFNIIIVFWAMLRTNNFATVSDFFFFDCCDPFILALLQAKCVGPDRRLLVRSYLDIDANMRRVFTLKASNLAEAAPMRRCQRSRQTARRLRNIAQKAEGIQEVRFPGCVSTNNESTAAKGNLSGLEISPIYQRELRDPKPFERTRGPGRCN